MHIETAYRVKARSVVVIFHKVMLDVDFTKRSLLLFRVHVRVDESVSVVALATGQLFLSLGVHRDSRLRLNF